MQFASLYLGIIASASIFTAAGYYFALLKMSLVKLEKRIDDIESDIEDLWQDRLAPPNSRRKLNSRGSEVMEQSGIKEIIDNHNSEILSKLNQSESSHPVDIEKSLIRFVVNDLYKNLRPREIVILKNGSMKTGESIRSILLTGAYYFRDKSLQNGVMK